MARIQGQFSNTIYLGTRLEYYEKDYSVVNNTSTVHVDAYILSLNNGYGSCGTSRQFYVTVGNETKSVTVPSWNIVKNEVWLVGSFDFVVKHENDGSKIVSISSSYDTNVSALGSSSLSANLILTKIARQSTISCPDFNIGSSTTININRADSSYTHTITYRFVNFTGTIAEKTNLTSFGWTPPAEEFYKQISNYKVGAGVLYCTTYHNNTQIGNTTEYQFKAVVINAEPIVQVTIEDANNDTVSLTGNNDILVKYKSKAKITVNSTAQYSSTIKSIGVLCGDGKSAGSSDVSSAVFELENVESKDFAITVIDSRGFSTYVTVSKEMIDYIPISIKNYTVKRLNPTSNIVTINASGNYFKNSFGTSNNSLTTKFRFKELGGEWTDYFQLNTNISETENSYSIYEQLNQQFDYRKQWEFELIVSDKLSSETYTLKVLKGIPTTQKSEREFQVNGTIYQADINGQNAVSINEMIQRAVDELKPKTLFTGTLYSQGTIDLPNVSEYKKLEIYWKAYVGNSVNTGGGANVLTLNLAEPTIIGGKRWAIGGAIVPYCTSLINERVGDFSIRANVNITDGTLSIVIHYNGNVTGQADAYSVYKVLGYK